jgi:hypothetical protein
MERTSLAVPGRAPAGDWTGLGRRLEQRFGGRAAADHLSVQFMTSEGTGTETIGRLAHDPLR